jgi:hypothetical protein
MAMSLRAAEAEARGQRVLHLEVGQPSTGAPAPARAAVAAAMERADPLGYTNAPGSWALRRRIAQHYDERYDVTVEPADILVVGGASAGFTLAFLAAFDAGDRVGVIEPGYPCYRNALLAMGVEPVAIPVGPATRWAPTAELLAAAGPLDGLVIASPSNPTGTVLSAERLEMVVAVVRAAGRATGGRRDLPRHHLWRAGPHRAGIHPRRRRGEQLQQVLQHDRLAARLDGGAQAPARRGRAAAAEPVHLRAARVADCRAGGLRRCRRTRRSCAALCREPRPAHRRPGRSGHHRSRGGRRCVLRLRRRHRAGRRGRRVDGAVRAVAGTARRGRHARAGFRPGPRRPVRAVQLRRFGATHRRSVSAPAAGCAP